MTFFFKDTDDIHNFFENVMTLDYEECEVLKQEYGRFLEVPWFEIHLEYY